MASFSVIKPTEPGGLPLPGICKSCGSPVKEWYLDTGTQENEYGAVLYCNECMNHIAVLLGYISPEKALELKSLTEQYYVALLDRDERISKLEGAIHDLVSGGYRNPAISFVELDLVHLDSLITVESGEREDDVDSGEIIPSEPINVERVDDLPPSGSQFTLFDS